MDHRYLWEQRGVPDAFAVKLETALAAKRARVKAVGIRRQPWTLRFVGGACLVAAAAAVFLWFGSFEADDVAPPASSPVNPAVAVETETPSLGTELPASETTNPDEGAKTKPASDLPDAETGITVPAATGAPTTVR